MSTTTVTLPSGLPSSMPAVITLLDGDEVVVVMQGVALPRSIFVDPEAGDTITLKVRASAAGAWHTFGAVSSADELQLTAPIQALSIQRTAGTGTTSSVEIV